MAVNSQLFEEGYHSSFSLPRSSVGSPAEHLKKLFSLSRFFFPFPSVVGIFVTA